MGLGIEEILRPALRDRSIRFVFPSEICAEAWLAESLRMGLKAVEADRFLGWDRLKESAAGAQGRPAADDFLRRIFAANLLARNAERPFLVSIVPPSYAELWQPFAGYLASRLPALGSLPGAMRAAGKAGLGPAADWLEVRARYEAFLRDIGRFEPAYEAHSLRELPGRTVIFFPELIEDFEEYRSVLEAAPSVTLAGLPAQGASASLRRPDTALAEIRQALTEAGELLDSGMPAERIAITVAGLDRYRPYLEREATLLSLPLALRAGQKLSATSGGRLFASLREVSASDYSFDALRGLLLSPAWPWKDPGLGRRIMDEGMRMHAIASWPEGGRKVDAWEGSLHGELLSGYRRLKTRIGAISAAPDFKALLKAYNAFKSEFLSGNREDWEGGADLSLARCVVELEGLVQAQAEARLEVPGAFGLFMRALETKPYVGAGRGAGIPVYEWRVAAGIPPERHFILNASQDSLAVPSRGFDFLGETLRRELGAALFKRPEEAWKDSGPAFIAAYALSGARVSFSCPQSGFDGEKAAHGFLVSMSREEEPAPRTDASYREEAAWLSGRGPAPATLHRSQALGLAAAASAPSSAPAGAEGVPLLGPETAALAAGRLYREGESRASMDSSAIDSYLACPYAYLYLRLLDAEPEPSGIAFVDPIFLGEVYHETLAILFSRIRESDGRFKPERADEYATLVGTSLSEAFGSLARKRGPFVGIVLEAFRSRLELYLRNLLVAEAERFPDLEIGPLEAGLELDYPALAGGVVLRGRIDRLSRSAKGVVIVDYKKGALPSRGQVAPDESGAMAEAQIPCYLRLVSSAGSVAEGGAFGGRDGDAGATAIDSAWYLSIEGNSRREAGAGACAFGDDKSAYVPREGLEAFLAAFDAALRRTALGIFAGLYPLAPRETQKLVCADCGARGICRERYALRFAAAGGLR
jgi:hypothetical protein